MAFKKKKTSSKRDKEQKELAAEEGSQRGEEQEDGFSDEEVTGEKDKSKNRRTFRLFNTSVEIRTDQGERMWDVAIIQALVERMGCNNTGYISQVCPAKDYNRFVLSHKGENFFGCSMDITSLPYFDVYRERARQLLARHIANAVYGLPLSVFDRGYTHRMRDRPIELAELEAITDERMEGIVQEAQRDWREQCTKMRERYGDVYAEVFGPDAPPPAPHDLNSSNDL